MADSSTYHSTSDINRRHNPLKNRSRKPNAAAAAAAVRSKGRSAKKPYSNASNITYQCTECERVFFSDKARFGHMRCHPDRQWRGMIPPLSFRRPVSVSSSGSTANFEQSSIIFTEEELNIAYYLILLANSPNLIAKVSDCRFECSSCKKVFGSHNELEEHRANRNNAKGCLAITKSDEETEECALFRDFGRERAINLDDKISMTSCSRVFSTGLAIDGRNSRVKESASGAEQGFVNVDLNMPAPDEDDSSSSYSSGLILDLRLSL